MLLLGCIIGTEKVVYRSKLRYCCRGELGSHVIWCKLEKCYKFTRNFEEKCYKKIPSDTILDEFEMFLIFLIDRENSNK